MSDFFSDENAVKSNFIKWGKVGDFCKGTLMSIREVANNLPGKEGEMSKLYELKIETAQYHDIDPDTRQAVEPQIVVNAGEIYNVGGKPAIDQQMRNIKIGQIVGFKFTETKPSKTKGFAATKIVKVYQGEMDMAYLKANAEHLSVDEIPF
jgi:hypothetical protein